MCHTQKDAYIREGDESESTLEAKWRAFEEAIYLVSSRSLLAKESEPLIDAAG